MIRSTVGKAARMYGGALGLWRVAYALMAVVVAFAIATGTAHAASQIDQQQTSVREGDFDYTDRDWPIAQTFTAGMTGTMDKVSVYAGCCPGGAPPGDMIVRVLAVDGSGKPTGGALASGVVPKENVPSSNLTMAWTDVALSPAAPVNAGTQYALVMSSETATSSQVRDSYLWGGYFPADSDYYIHGEHLWFNFTTNQWNVGAGDLAFKTYVETSPPDPLAPPANDDFANAQQITVDQATASGTNGNATKQSGEPNHAADDGGKSVWYEWTAQQSGDATIDTRGSSFDTLLGVYTGSAVNGLTEVRSNDDESYPDLLTSKVSFAASAGTTYRIAVDGYRGNSGNVSLRLALSTPPPDTTAPDAPVITSPENNSFDADGNVTLSGTAEAGSTVEVFEVTTSGNVSKVKTPVDSTGAWAKTLDAETEGSHTYTATATDAAGNASAESAARTVVVDMTAPTVEGWTPKGKKVPPTAKPTVTFSEAMDEGSVEATNANGQPTTFALYKKGSSVSLGATIAYDAATDKATLDPTKNLRRGVTYRAVVSVGATDLAGNALAENKVWSFQIRR